MEAWAQRQSSNSCTRTSHRASHRNTWAASIPPPGEQRSCSLYLLFSCDAVTTAHHSKASSAPGRHCQHYLPPHTALRMPVFTGNSPSHIEAEAQVKYCVADPWKARTRWKPPGRHQLDPALPDPPLPAKPRGKGPGAQHSKKEGYWEDWLRHGELWGRMSPPNPTPVIPTLPHQHRIDRLDL